ncbi:hypothetical protein PAHAL_4G121300 [Panicum hallii]|jgi:hypothetical protein|uniref:RING-type E3 ubiquitin transferase n=1 Tax=Panicum hallii TaxID=206008 RepID=A0A2S3HIT8_9POAL|nr:RING-H2 finger protein ATL68-like [Panicum hallii]PAN23826.1 hypothetical protein PAHAL_4G121300 [Panicum hallii]
MAGYLPTDFPYFRPPPPPRWWRSPPPPPPSPPIQVTSQRSRDNSPASHGGVIAGVAISVAAFLLVLTFVCSLCRGYRNSRANAAADAAAAAAALAARPRVPAPPVLLPVAWDDENEDQQHLRGRDRSSGRPRRVSPTAGLPSFTYDRSVRHNVTGSGEEAATCSVCLGAFQTGETVRLLPVCLHLYHVECIDPWLDAHATCPICRSGTDPDMDGSLLPPV